MDANILNTLIADVQFKAHLPYLKLARDCLSANPLVSYWALYYVLEQGIRTPVQDDAFRRQLGVIMTVLEKVRLRGRFFIKIERLIILFFTRHAHRRKPLARELTRSLKVRPSRASLLKTTPISCSSVRRMRSNWASVRGKELLFSVKK